MLYKYMDPKSTVSTTRMNNIYVWDILLTAYETCGLYVKYVQRYILFWRMIDKTLYIIEQEQLKTA